jgi:MerR family transcriptional regulator/heat shock protein HspR
MDERPGRDPERPVYVISVAAELVRAHPRTLRIYELEGLICPARTRSNIRLYSENDIRRVLWIRHLTRNLGVNLAGVRVLFELEERIGMRILERLYADRDNNPPAGRKGTGASSVPRPTTTRIEPDVPAASPLPAAGAPQGAK